MTSAALDVFSTNPPASTHTVQTSGAVGCPTTWTRPLLRPHLAEGPRDGVDTADPHVRRFWVAALGPSAVTDLLRLVAAARDGRAVKAPLRLSPLLQAGLVRWWDGELEVLYPIPRLPRQALLRLSHQRRHRLSVPLDATGAR